MAGQQAATRRDPPARLRPAYPIRLGDMVRSLGEVAAHFDGRADSYAKHRNWVNDRLSLMPIVSLLRQKPGVTLEIGAGTGAVARICGPLVPGLGAYVGLDLSHSMLMHHVPQAPAVVADAHRLPFAAQSATVVICRQSIHYFDVPDVVLSEIGRVLAPDGRLLIAQIVSFDDPVDRAWWETAMALRQPLRRRRWTSEDIEESVRGAGFAVESRQYLRRRTSLKGWLDRYPLSSQARQALIEHFGATPRSVRELREFAITSEEIEYWLRWVFITARLADAPTADPVWSGHGRQ